MAKSAERLHVADLHIEKGMQLGRNVDDSYQRYGALARPDHWKDPLFNEAVAVSGGRSIMEPTKARNLYLLIRYYLGALDDQNIVEFGSYKGGSALFMAFLLKKLHPGATLHALDTYGGMPPASAQVDLHRQGDFKDADLKGFKARAEEFGLDNLIIVKGMIEDTFPKISRDVRFGLAHIDVDIYSAVKYAQDAVWDRMTPRGYIAFDDANAPTCVGATQAVEEFIMYRRIFSEQVWPHYVFRAP